MAHPSKRPVTENFPPDGQLARMAQLSQVDFELLFFGKILQRHPSYIDVLRVHASNLSLKGLHEESLAVDRQWVHLRPEDPLAHYNLACSYALTHQPDRAVEALRRAVECGYRDFRHMLHDRDLQSIQQDPRFRQLLRDYETS